MLLIGQWEHRNAFANNENAGNIKFVDPEGILESPDEKMKKRGEEQLSTTSQQEKRAKVVALSELKHAINVEVKHPGLIREKHWPDFDGWTYKCKNKVGKTHTTES